MPDIALQKKGKLIVPPLKLAVQVKTNRHDTTIIDSHSLESQIDSQLCWVLSQINLGDGSTEQIAFCKRYLNHFRIHYPTWHFFAEYISSNFEKPAEPVCMVCETESDLFDQLSTIYQLMYFHYFLGKSQKIHDSFPYYCCGVSTRNLTIALWDAGVIAAVSVHDSIDDHSYVIVPFRIRQTGRIGVILADPTSDQLYRDQRQKVRNYLAVLPPRGWQYRTEWAGGSDLYPQFVQVSICHGTENKNYNDYLETVFQNNVCLET